MPNFLYYLLVKNNKNVHLIHSIRLPRAIYVPILKPRTSGHSGCNRNVSSMLMLMTTDEGARAREAARAVGMVRSARGMMAAGREAGEHRRNNPRLQI